MLVLCDVHLHQGPSSCDVTLMLVLCDAHLHQGPSSCDVILMLVLCDVHLHQGPASCDVTLMLVLYDAHLHQGPSSCDVIACGSLSTNKIGNVCMSSRTVNQMLSQILNSLHEEFNVAW